MSEQKWTKGPWHADGTIIRDAKDEPIAVVVRAPRADCGELGAAANAALLAAAPDLYEALADLMPTLEASEFTDHPCVKQARAALARAGGSQ